MSSTSSTPRRRCPRRRATSHTFGHIASGARGDIPRDPGADGPPSPIAKSRPPRHHRRSVSDRRDSPDPLGSRAMTDQPRTVEDVKAIVEEHQLRFIRFWFTDILGQLKSFSINSAELDDAFENGMGFDGSSITGFNAIEESDMIAMPDPSTFAILPWRPEEQGVGRVFCDVLTPERTPVRGRSAPRPATSARPHARDGLRHLQRRPRARVLPLQGQERHRGPRRGRLLRPHDARRRLRRPPRDRHRARAARHPRGVLPPRGRPLPARGRHALRRTR